MAKLSKEGSRDILLTNFSFYDLNYKYYTYFIQEVFTVAKYACPCGYVYDEELGDPENGIAPGTAWADVPEDFVCPVCGLGKDVFVEE